MATTTMNPGPPHAYSSALVIMDFDDVWRFLLENHIAIEDGGGNEPDFIMTLLNQIITDFVYINDSECWPQDYETYYRSLFDPKNQHILDRLFELIETTVVTHLPFFMTAGWESRNHIDSFSFATDTGTVVHMCMPHWVFEAFTNPTASRVPPFP